MLLGVTGGIGTGKSAVLRMLGDLGAITLSADSAARAAVAPGSPGALAVAAEFGPEYVRPDGSVDRRALGRLVFGDEDARKRLEAIVHPEVFSALRREIAEARARRPPPSIIAVEAPLLYEAGMESWFDRVLVVAASPGAQLARLRAGGLSDEEAKSRIAAQWPLEAKIERADNVIWNDGDLDVLRSRVAEAVEALRRQPATGAAQGGKPGFTSNCPT